MPEALKDAAYRATTSFSISMSGDGIAAKAGALIAGQYCPQVSRLDLTEMGAYQEDRRVWIVLAAPFAPQVALANDASGQRVLELVNQARAQGHEVLLQVPMEPFDYPDNDPGPQTLLTSSAPEQNLDRLTWHMARFQGYVGLSSFMGTRFVATDAAKAGVSADTFIATTAPAQAMLEALAAASDKLTADFGQIALRATEKVQEAVALLSDMKNAPHILNICREVSEIESDADHVMRAGMTRLFAEISDARALIRAHGYEN